jgi:hypothetical protein
MVISDVSIPPGLSWLGSPIDNVYAVYDSI